MKKGTYRLQLQHVEAITGGFLDLPTLFLCKKSFLRIGYFTHEGNFEGGRLDNICAKHIDAQVTWTQFCAFSIFRLEGRLETDFSVLAA